MNIIFGVISFVGSVIILFFTIVTIAKAISRFLDLNEKPKKKRHKRK